MLFLKQSRKYARKFPRQLLLIDVIRNIICAVRFFWFVKICRNLQILDPLPAGASKNTVLHNIKGLKDFAVPRSHNLIRPLVAVHLVRDEQWKKKVLTVGPRAEGEIFNLIAYGFSRRNIRGLDLISYSPFVDLGDMHAMPYPNSSFDVIILGWVIAYSEDRERVAQEILRVAKDGAIVAVGVSHNPLSNEEIENQLGYLPGASKRIVNTDQILELFGTAVNYVYFSQDADGKLSHKVTGIISIFSISKQK